jgi:uncharacterized damage-inducible protein DinB
MLLAQSIPSISDAMLAEFEEQALITRRFLERLPEDKLTWKPHEKSMTAGQLAYHIAGTTGVAAHLVERNPATQPGQFSFPQPASSEEILDKLDESIATVHEVLSKFDDTAMTEIWRLSIAGKDILAMPRGVFLRNVMLSHWYQHRGQFSVYLRLLNIPVPASWGPSADEPPLFMQKQQAARSVFFETRLDR